MSSPLVAVDPATIAELSGRFEPVDTEIDATDLSVEGEVPRDLTGSYFRNGPNPRFTPLGSYTCRSPLSGDGASRSRTLRTPTVCSSSSKSSRSSERPCAASSRKVALEGLRCPAGQCFPRSVTARPLLRRLTTLRT